MSTVILRERFAAIGFPRVEATSCSNPKVVPQFSGASELLRLLKRKTYAYCKATCANPKAVQRALTDLDAGCGVNEISLLVSATESHTQKNLKRSRAGQWANIEEMVHTARGRFRMVGGVGGHPAKVKYGGGFTGNVCTEEQPPIPSVTGKQPERGRAVAQARAHRRNRAGSLALN